MKKKLIPLLLLLIWAVSVKSQGMYVENLDGNTTSINIGDVDVVNFPETNMIVNMTNNSTQSFSLYTIKKITFAQNTVIIPDESISTKIKVFPNPVVDDFTILNLPENVQTIIIYNLQGREIFRKEVGSSTNTADISMLPNGLYFLKINNTVIKIIKQ